MLIYFLSLLWRSDRLESNANTWPRGFPSIYNILDCDIYITPDGLSTNIITSIITSITKTCDLRANI